MISLFSKNKQMSQFIHRFQQSEKLHQSKKQCEDFSGNPQKAGKTKTNESIPEKSREARLSGTNPVHSANPLVLTFPYSFSSFPVFSATWLLCELGPLFPVILDICGNSLQPHLQTC